MDDVDDVLSYLKLDPDHHEKIAALIPKVRSVSHITANIYGKSRNLPNTDVRNYSIGLR